MDLELTEKSLKTKRPAIISEKRKSFKEGADMRYSDDLIFNSPQKNYFLLFILTNIFENLELDYMGAVTTSSQTVLLEPFLQKL